MYYANDRIINFIDIRDYIRISQRTESMSNAKEELSECLICGNIEDFLVINTKQYDAKWKKERNSFLLTNSKILSADFYCNSEQCKGKQNKITQVIVSTINSKEVISSAQSEKSDS